MASIKIEKPVGTTQPSDGPGSGSIKKEQTAPKPKAPTSTAPKAPTVRKAPASKPAPKKAEPKPREPKKKVLGASKPATK